jgi:hypothetical protein
MQAKTQREQQLPKTRRSFPFSPHKHPINRLSCKDEQPYKSMSWQQYSASEKPGRSACFVLKWQILPLMNNSDLTFYINHLLSTCTTPQIPPGIINDEFQEKVYPS